MGVGAHLDRWPGRLGPPLAAALAFLLLLGAIGVGLRVAPFGLLLPFGNAPGLDYSAGPFRGISPLEPNFIERVLGDFLPERPRTVEAPPRPGRSVRPPVPGTLPFSETHPPTNDAIAHARSIPSIPYQAKTETTTASSETGEPSDCGSLGGTVWYRYSPPKDIGLVANTIGSNYPTTLGVFSGEAGSLRNVGCDSDVKGNAIVPFPAERNTTYFFQIAGARGGDLVFNLEQQARITLESVSASGERGDGSSSEPALSADGRYLAFVSYATNLAAGSDGSPCAIREPGQGLPYVLTAASDSPCRQILVRDRATGAMSVASRSSRGELANRHSWHPAISADGRYVAFTSAAANLVSGDTNEGVDVFLRDLLTERTERVSVSSSGEEIESLDGEHGAESPSVSFDGRYVIFESTASNLVADDTNGGPDVFVRDRLRETTERVSVSSSGDQAELIGSTVDYVRPRNDPHPASPCISPNGRFVAFRSSAFNLVPGDRNARADVFVRDLLTRRTVRVSVSSEGEEANGDSGPLVGYRGGPCISADGRYVAFSSQAFNLVARDSNHVGDVFVHDLALHRTVRVSVSSSGVEGDREARHPTLSADGRYVAFESHSSTLAPGEYDSPPPLNVFVHDLRTRTTSRVSLTSAGEWNDGDAGNGYISGDGSIVAFDSVITTSQDPLHEGSRSNVFVHELARRV